MGVIAEEESLEKRRKIDGLRLSSVEWTRLSTFSNILAVSGGLDARLFLYSLSISDRRCSSAIILFRKTSYLVQYHSGP
jgi:hypothetical protein